jgi:hypothetical protein
MLTYFGHLRGENALGAIQGGKCPVKLSHMATNRRVLFYQINPMLTIGDVQCRLYAGDATTNNQDIGIKWSLFNLQRLLILDSPYRSPD